MGRERIKWIDCAKGIAILLVLIGHTIYKPMVRGTIFAFHMPVFFILSAYTISISNSKNEYFQKFKKNFKALIIPAVCTFLVFRLGMYFVYDFNGFNIEKILHNICNCIVALFWSCGYYYNLGNWHIEPLGALWFMVVLFISKEIFDVLIRKTGKKISGIICVVMTVVGYLLGYFGIWLPFSIDIAFFIMLFLWFGYMLRNQEVNQYIYVKFIASAVVFFVMLIISYKLSNTYLELAVRKYPLFPMCYIIAIIGSMCLIYACNIIDNWKKVSAVNVIYDKICIIGRNSLYLYLIHVLDPIWFQYLSYHITNEWILMVIRLIVDVMILYIVLKVKKNFRKRKEVTEFEK